MNKGEEVSERPSQTNYQESFEAQPQQRSIESPETFEAGERDEQRTTARNLGAFGIIMVMTEPEFVREETEQQALEVVENKTEREKTAETGGGAKFAQDQEAYQPFAQRAANIVYAALQGSKSVYGMLTPEFAEFFRVRVGWHEDEWPSDFEQKAMISTVCIDLYRQAYGRDPEES